MHFLPAIRRRGLSRHSALVFLSTLKIYPRVPLTRLRPRVTLLSACAQLANVLSTEALFYACIFPFIAFFGSFAFVLYPLRDTLHPTGVLLKTYPQTCLHHRAPLPKHSR